MPSTSEAWTQRRFHEITPVKKLTFLHARPLHGATRASDGSLPVDPSPAFVEHAVAPDLDEGIEHGDDRGPVSKSGVVLSAPPRDEIRASESFTAADCPCCFRPLIVSWKDARPASDVLQDAFGCDPGDLYRFFDRDEWLQRWELPLAMTWGTASDWRAIGGIWRATRARRNGGFLSLADIARGTKRGECE
jgi:hypothetical protein